jgi:S-adenosylmethionine:tRNA ribosyltransferase-isomerase
VLAKYPASIAAPTASLHFTKRLLKKLDQEKFGRTEVTLHVGAGTFAPIDESNFKTKKLFTEYLDITKSSAHIINAAKESGNAIIPVGTTAMRTIESAAVHSKGTPRNVASGAGKTDIFIYPSYKFKIADGLITNFHVPRSSLMLLVDALLEHKHAKRRILDLYKIAVKEKFRFYSFGDGMLIT